MSIAKLNGGPWPDLLRPQDPQLSGSTILKWPSVLHIVFEISTRRSFKVRPSNYVNQNKALGSVKHDGTM